MQIFVVVIIMALIVNSIKDSLKNHDRGKFQRDIFGTSCISGTVKATVFEMDRSDKIVLAGR